jgi:hypothetical protein
LLGEDEAEEEQRQQREHCAVRIEDCLGLLERNNRGNIAEAKRRAEAGKRDVTQQLEALRQVTGYLFGEDDGD